MGDVIDWSERKQLFLSYLFPLIVCIGFYGLNTHNPMTGEGVPSKAESNIQKKTIIQDLCWSANGNHIYFSAMQVEADYSDYLPELWTIYRYDLKERTMEVIIRSALNPAISPSGRYLAAAVNENERRRIRIFDFENNRSRLLLETEAKTASPSWSPNGERLAFVGTIDGTEEIYVCGRLGNDLERISFNDGHKAYNPAWSPDGNMIAYFLEKGDGRDQVHIMNADGSDDRNITQDTFNNIFPGWIDNATLIYGQGRKGGPTLTYQIRIDSKDKQQVLDLQSMYARYSPDGKMIACITEDGGIDIISLDGSLIEKIELIPK